MIRRYFYGLVFCVVGTLPLWAGSGPDFNAGQWEVTSQVEIPGMPMQMPPTTIRQCLQKESPVPTSGTSDQGCEIEDVNYSGNTVTWTVTCQTPHGQMVGKGRTTYAKEEMEGTMSMEGPGMQMTIHYLGHRLGDCP